MKSKLNNRKCFSFFFLHLFIFFFFLKNFFSSLFCFVSFSFNNRAMRTISIKTRCFQTTSKHKYTKDTQIHKAPKRTDGRKGRLSSYCYFLSAVGISLAFRTTGLYRHFCTEHNLHSGVTLTVICVGLRTACHVFCVRGTKNA